MRIFVRIAFRNLRRHLRRTTLTVSSVALGLSIVLWLQCVMTGRSQRIIEMITSSASGHLQVYDRKYFKDKEIFDSFKQLPESFQRLLPAGTQRAYRVYLPSLSSSGEHSSPIQLIGIEPLEEAKITQVSSSVTAGAFLEPEPDPDCPSRQILLGKPLAELLGVDVGDKVVILAQAADGSLGNDLFRVKGIYETQSRSFDKAFAYAPMSCVQKVGMIHGYHEAVLKLPDSSRISDPMLRDPLAAALPPELMLTDWRDIYPLIAGMVKYSDAIVVLISVMLFSVITFGIINTLFMSVSERISEFGVMIALGTSRKQLVTIVALECLIMGVLAALIGTAIGLAVVLYQQKAGFDVGMFMGERSDVNQFHLERIVYPVIRIAPFMKMVLISVLTVVAAGLIPAYRASKLKPVDAINAH
jgi:ABC-type lipoprotein release transport system permease subunit